MIALPQRSPIQDFIASTVSYAAVIWIFAGALAAPENNINFIYNVGFFMFVTEFMSLHAAVMLTQPKQWAARLWALGIYLVMLVIFSAATHTVYPALVFGLSLVAKLFRRPAKQASGLIGPMLIFMATAFLVAYTAGPIARAFPLSEAVLSQRPENASGIFVDTPQALLIWGILYYGAMILFQAWQTFKRKD